MRKPPPRRRRMKKTDHRPPAESEQDLAPPFPFGAGALFLVLSLPVERRIVHAPVRSAARHLHR